MPDWKTRPRPGPVTLEGQYCLLEPLDAARHQSDLLGAYGAAPDGREWTCLSAGPFENDEAQFHAHMKKLTSSPDAMHFAVIDKATQKAEGTMALMWMDPPNGVIEVGQIAFSLALQRTRAATEAQYLIMRFVFDQLGYRRYEWKCDDLNAASRRAALRLGFTFEGLFRQAAVYKQRSRDTAWYAMTDTEWPELRVAFSSWLMPSNFEGDQQLRSLASFRCSAQSGTNS